MIRYIIQQRETGKFLKRVKSGYGIRSTWVDSADDATLITTGSAATIIARQFCVKMGGYPFTLSNSRIMPGQYPVKVIKVQCLLIPEGIQPFVNGMNKHVAK